MMTLAVVTDGRRDCIEQTLASAAEHLRGPVDHRIIYDDSGDPENRAWLTDMFGDFTVLHHSEGRQGFGGAIRHVWRWLAQTDENPYLFWLEDDFTFNRPVDLLEMAMVLEERPLLLQLVLRRQPWNEQERTAGGIIERHPADYIDCHDGFNDWLEHRRFWSTNPHLTRMGITKVGWPEDPHSEGKFTQRMLVDPDIRFGFWGARESGEWVNHIGHQRAGIGY